LIQAFARLRREGWEVLRLFARNGNYDLDDMTSIFNLFEDYVIRREKYPLLPLTPNPVADRRIAKVYYTMLVQANAHDPVASFDMTTCMQNPELQWNSNTEIREVADNKTGMCMRKVYHKPQGKLAPITVQDIWEVLDARPFM
jgi:hypothetical protein